MLDVPEFLLRAVLTGAGATLVMDVWALLLQRLWGVPSLDYVKRKNQNRYETLIGRLGLRR